ncbi:MAG: alpha/beta hydrolase [Actinomycetota bacterium]
MTTSTEIQIEAGWQSVDLPSRGLTWAVDQPGPAPDAPAVVLLHGFGATGSVNWGSMIGDLAERYRVVALDHRGHGRGIRPDEPFTLEDCADDVVALLDVLRIRRAVLVGYSMGGAIAQLAAHRHPRRIAGLVFLASAARFSIPPASELLTLLISEAMWFSDRLPIAGHSMSAIHGAVRSLDRFDSRPWLHEVAAPATVILTTKDRVVRPHLQGELAAIVSEGRTIDLAAGHMVPLVDRTATLDALRPACDEVATRAGLFDWGSARAVLRRWHRRRPADERPPAPIVTPDLWR